MMMTHIYKHEQISTYAIKIPYKTYLQQVSPLSYYCLPKAGQKSTTPDIPKNAFKFSIAITITIVIIITNFSLISFIRTMT